CRKLISKPRLVSSLIRELRHSSSLLRAIARRLADTPQPARSIMGCPHMHRQPVRYTRAERASSRGQTCVSASLPVRLIINADDFGLTCGVNRAIDELHDGGAVTSATLMANGAAFDDAVALALARPSLRVGCHIVLVDGLPVSDPASIPTLLGPDRRSFRMSLADFALGVLRGAITHEDIERETLAQIKKLQRAGLKLTHADTHKHTHLLSRVTRPIIRALEQSGVRCIRNPFEPRWAATLSGSTRRSLFVR